MTYLPRRERKKAAARAAKERDAAERAARFAPAMAAARRAAEPQPDSRKEARHGAGASDLVSARFRRQGNERWRATRSAMMRRRTEEEYDDELGRDERASKVNKTGEDW